MNKLFLLFFHKKRKETAERIFSGNDFRGKFTVFLTKELKDVFREIRNKKLEGDLLDMEGYNYIKSFRSVESWTYPSKWGKVRSIYVYKACKLLKKNPYKFVPSAQLKYIKNGLEK